MFVQPVAAAVFGVLLGVLLMVVSYRAVCFVTPTDPFGGVVVVGALMGARFLVALAALAGFHFFAPDGLAPFGIALISSFMVGLFVEAIRLVRPHTSTST